MCKRIKPFGYKDELKAKSTIVLLNLHMKEENGKEDNQHGFSAKIEVIVRVKWKNGKGDN